MIESDENYKQIDDIIDARKKLGQYNVFKNQTTTIPCRYAYSTTAAGANADKFTRFDDNVMANEGDYLNNNSELKRTDSEITIVRVRCDGLSFKRRPSKWDMHDIAIPGDGSHLGESPSLVNLATLVVQNDEYLVPLSSWDPYYSTTKSEEGSVSPGKSTVEFDDCDDKSSVRTDKHDDEDFSNVSEFSGISYESQQKSTKSHTGLAGKISKFLRRRRHCKKPKTLEQLPSNSLPSNNRL